MTGARRVVWRRLGLGLVALGGVIVAASVLWWLVAPNEAGLRRGVVTLWTGSALMMLGLLAFTLLGCDGSGAPGGRGRGWALLGLAIGLRLAVAWWPPWLSDDVYRYLWDGMLLAQGIDPFAFVPTDPALAFAHGTDLFARLNSAGFYSVYPPLTQLAFSGPGWLTAAHGWEAGYAGWKGLVLGVEIAGLLYAHRSLGPRAFAWIGWHPLFVIELSGQGHTEIFLWPLLLIALNSSDSTRKWAGIAGAILSKLTPLLLVPELIRTHGFDRRRALGMLLGTGILAFVAFGGIDSVRHASESLGLYARYFEFNAGPYYTVKAAFQAVTGADWSKRIGPAMGMAALVVVGLIWLRAVRHPERWPLARVAYAVFATLVVLATTVHPWYLVPVLLCAAVLLDRQPACPFGFWAWQWLALCSLATYARYFDGPYALIVGVGWIGWACWMARDTVVARSVQRARPTTSTGSLV